MGSTGSMGGRGKISLSVELHREEKPKAILAASHYSNEIAILAKDL